MMKQKINVIGGGFSGMTLAWQLAKKGFPVALYEKQNRLGGVIQTRLNDFGQAESAANGIMLSDDVLELFSDIGFSPVSTKSESNKRYIYRDKPKQWPLKIFESLFLLVRLVKVLIFGKKSIEPRSHQTIAEWSNQHFSSALTEFLLAPALQGIYAGDAHKMSATLILGPFFKNKKKRQSKQKGMVSGANGMEELIQKLAERLQALGVSIHLGQEVNSDQLSGPSVISTSVREAQAMLKEKNPAVSSKLEKIETAPIVTVTTYWKSFPQIYRGFGVLLPQAYQFQTLGILMNSFIYPFRDKFCAETYILGGPLRSSVIDWSDEKVLEKIQEERFKILGEKTELVSQVITRWPDGLPQYNVSLEKVLASLELPENIFLHGNYLGQIGLTKILSRSKELAEVLALKYH